jgi:hypothetical protein
MGSTSTGCHLHLIYLWAGIAQVAAVGIGKLGYASNTLILLYKQDSLPTKPLA